MYTDEDLNLAVEKNVFSADAVEAFRNMISSSNGLSAVDEENFRLVGGFNDIFIVIACALLLFSSLWLTDSISEVLGYAIFTGLSWGLAEVFVLKRNMALPAILLLLAFVGGIFAFFQALSSTLASTLIISTALSTLAAYLHWRRFKVPMTIAVGTGSGLMLLAFIMRGVFPESISMLMTTLFFCGCITFIYAMYWDSADRSRTTQKSDVAFWLHLLSAPLIVHPIFLNLGVLDGNESLGNMILVVLLYLLMAVLSIVIDRRVFMVSSLIYVIYALSNFIDNDGSINYSFPLTGVVIGAFLLLLSIYWQRVRILFVVRLPQSIQRYVPAIKDKG